MSVSLFDRTLERDRVTDRLSFRQSLASADFQLDPSHPVTMTSNQASTKDATASPLERLFHVFIRPTGVTSDESSSEDEMYVRPRAHSTGATGTTRGLFTGKGSLRRRRRRSTLGKGTKRAPAGLVAPLDEGGIGELLCCFQPISQLTESAQDILLRIDNGRMATLSRRERPRDALPTPRPSSHPLALTSEVNQATRQLLPSRHARPYAVANPDPLIPLSPNPSQSTFTPLNRPSYEIHGEKTSCSKQPVAPTSHRSAFVHFPCPLPLRDNPSLPSFTSLRTDLYLLLYLVRCRRRT